MKVIIIGAGAMGGLYGAFLSKKNQVIMVDTFQKVVDKINNQGITVREQNGEEKVFKNNISACVSGECDERADLVIMFVKSIYLENALEQNKNLFHDDTVVLTLQNGAGNDRKIERYVRKENVIIGTSKHNAVSEECAVIRHTGSGATTIGSNHHADKTLEWLGEMLRECSLETVISDDIQRIIWDKLFVNLSINAFTAITQTPIGYMIKDKYAWDFAKRLIYEAVEVAEEDGTYFDRRQVLESVRQTCMRITDGYSSMYQDRRRKMKTEIDVINGAIVEQEKLYGVPVPYNSLIVDLVHAIEGAYEYYG